MSSADGRKCVFLSWNVRGLNDPKKREKIRNFIKTENPDAICLQETKLSAINDTLFKEILGKSLDSRAFISSVGTA
jgi:exonuclease III